MQIYLASASPRRRELLQQINIDFQLLPSGIDESILAGESPEQHVERLARTKAETAWQHSDRTDNMPVLGADTIVVIDQKILGKPSSKQHAAEMLRLLSGKTHYVLSAIALCLQQNTHSIVHRSAVTFRDISDAEITEYLASDEAMDKAGAYGIQGYAAVFISLLEGSFSGVMGLPLYETAQLLQQFASTEQ